MQWSAIFCTEFWRRHEDLASSAVHVRDGGDRMGAAMVRVVKRRTVVRKERRWLREYILVEFEG